MPVASAAVVLRQWLSVVVDSFYFVVPINCVCFVFGPGFLYSTGT